MCLALSLVRLSEKTARRDLDVLKKRISDDLNSLLRKSGVAISAITVTPSGWLNATVNNGSLFARILDTSLRLPAVCSEYKSALATARIGERATSDGVEILLRDRDGTEKVFLKMDKLRASLPLIRKTEAPELLTILCLKPLFPIQLFLRGGVNLSSYQAELLVDWVRCGLDAIHVWDITRSELMEAVPKDTFRRLIADVEFYGVLAFRLLLKLGMDPLRLEDCIRGFCEKRWIQARIEVFQVEKARQIISPASWAKNV